MYLAGDILNSGTFSALASRIMIENENAALLDRDIELIKYYSQFAEEGAFLTIAKAHLRIVSDPDCDVTEIETKLQEALDSDPDSILGLHVLCKVYQLQSNWSAMLDTAESLKIKAVARAKDFAVSLDK